MDCVNKGTMVCLECPPITGTCNSSEVPVKSAPNVAARIISKVVTPNNFRALKLFVTLKISAIKGTIELTGLVMTKMNAVGHVLAISFVRVAIIPAFVSNKSNCQHRFGMHKPSRVIPIFGSLAYTYNEYYLLWDTSCHDDDISIFQCDDQFTFFSYMPRDFRRGVNMTQVNSNSPCYDNIIYRKFFNGGVAFEQ